MFIDELINFQQTRNILEERCAYETHLYKLRIQHTIMNLEKFFLENRPVQSFEYIAKNKKGHFSCASILSPQISLYHDIDFNLYDKNNQLKDNQKEKCDLKNVFSYLKFFFDNQQTLNIFREGKSQRFDKYVHLVKTYDIDPAFLKVIELFRKNQKNKTLPLIPKKITDGIKNLCFPLYNVSLPSLSFSEYEVNALSQDLRLSPTHNEDYFYFLETKILFDMACELFSHKTDLIKINIISEEDKTQYLKNITEGISCESNIISDLTLFNSLFGNLFGKSELTRDNVIPRLKKLHLVDDNDVLYQEINKFLNSLEENYQLKQSVAPEFNTVRRNSRL